MFPDAAVLLIIDVQKGFDAPEWGTRNNPGAERQMERLLQAWRASSRPIIHVQHLSRMKESVLHPQSTGCAIKDVVKPRGNELLIQKEVNSAFIGTELESYLRRQGYEALVIVGLTTNHCVSTTARMAGNLGFTTYVVSDTTATFDSTDHQGRRFEAADVHAIALASLHSEFATVLSTEDVLTRLATP